ncbi:MAG TPA: PAS domain S-box protein [Burkholderiales bacterium]|nr:PAS domain S-box protein [Burkholderiales bacterium]
MPSPLRVLIVEDSEDDARLLHRKLQLAGYDVSSERVDSAAAMRAALAGGNWDLVLCDYVMPGFGGPEALAVAKECAADLPLIVVSGKIDEQTAVEAMKAGAADFVAKAHLERLLPAVKRELAAVASRHGMRQAHIEWRAAFDAMRDASFFHDSEFRIVRANLAYAARAGMPTEDLIGKRYWEVFPKLDGPLPGCRSATEVREGWVEEEFVLPGGESCLSRSYRITNGRGEYLYSFHVLQDVTERNRVREAIEFSERKFRSLIENASDLVCVIDAGGLITYVSPSLGRLGGYEAGEVLGRNILEFTHPDDLRASEQALAAVVHGPDDPFHSELRFRRKDGGFAVLDSIARNLLGDPVLNGIVINARDVTERKRSEQALKLFRELIDRSSDAIEVVDPETLRYLDVNEKACQDLGYSRDELLSMRVTDVNPTLDASAIEALETQLRTSGSTSLETFHRRKDGSSFPVEVHVKRIHLDRAYQVVTVRDITARNRQRRELEFKNLILSTQSESSLDAILVVDENGRMISFNRRFVELWGVPEEVLQARSDERALQYALDKLDKPEEFLERVKYLYEHKDEKSSEVVRMSDGRFLDRYSAPMFGTAGKYHGRIWYFRDITERKRGEEQLKRLNWALRALGQSNSALVHASSEEELFRRCCEAITSAGGYPLAWIGISRDDPERSVQIVAAAGHALSYMEGFKVSWGEGPLGEGPVGTAIRTATTQVIEDFAASPTFAPWRERARASGLASAIALPIVAEGAAPGILTIYGQEVNAFGTAEIALFEELASDIGYGVAARRTRVAYDEAVTERAEQAQRLRATFESAIAALAATVEQRDPYTAGHQRRVAELATAIGRELGLDEHRLDGLRVASTIHDIGKIYVPAEILARPGRLSAAEFAIVKNHAQVGYDIVKGVDFPWPVADTIRQHHERLDGSGYPQGLKGEKIILEARILAVADVVEAIASHRPYRPAVGIEPGLQHIAAEAGRLYDPEVVAACVRLFNDKRFELPAH